MRILTLLITLVIISGCNESVPVTNQPLKGDVQSSDLYSLSGTASQRKQGKFSITIAISGGGARSAALSYGVMQGLKEQLVDIDGVQTSLLDEVDFISSVSGGSFTAAYYGLYGDKLFTDFKKDFLYHDIGSDLLWKTMNPSQWFSYSGRTDEAIAYYQEKLFHGATFADLDQENRPFIIINATDLRQGVRFSFTQEYFNLLCSDISSYPIANAVAASAAAPVVFNPVVLENYGGCENGTIPDGSHGKEQPNDVVKSIVEGLKSYSDKTEREYVHLVDGGITDNLGLLALSEIRNISKRFTTRKTRPNAKTHAITIAIDASTTPSSEMDHSRDEPGLTETIGFMTAVQIHRFNDATKSFYKAAVSEHAEANNVSLYYVDINLSDITDKSKKEYFNNIPTDMQLERVQVDMLIEEGMKQLRNNKAFMHFLTDIRK